jgi:hypothetical protein
VTLTQITERRGVIERVPDGQTPVLEMQLDPGQYIVGLRLTQIPPRRGRVTVDWRWTAYVVTPLS